MIETEKISGFKCRIYLVKVVFIIVFVSEIEHYSDAFFQICYIKYQLKKLLYELYVNKYDELYII